MLAQILGGYSFLGMYGILLSASLVFLFGWSSLFYFPLYVWKRKENFHWKTQLYYPSSETINRELFWAVVGAASAVLNPAIATYMQLNGYNKVYASISDYGVGYWLFSWFALFATNEVFQWWWHKLCHENKYLWQIHKIHHTFSNPSPFSVIANHPLDIWVQSSPLLWFPLILPIHDVTLYGHYATVAYLYGAYLHGGFDWGFWFTDPHSSFLVTAWHHNHHHHHGHYGKPINCGFVFSLVDKIGGTFEGPGKRRKDGGKCKCSWCRPESEVAQKYREIEEEELREKRPKKGVAVNGKATNGKHR